MTRANIRLGLGLSGLLALTLFACQPKSEEPKKAPRQGARDEIILKADSPKREYIEEATVTPEHRPLMDVVTGKIVYDESRTARVSSPITGRVTGRIAALGDRVQPGAPLAELDSPELGQAQSDYAGALADLSLAERAYSRTKELYDNGIAARKDFEQSQDTVERARIEADRARLKLANLGVHDKRTDDRFILHAPIGGLITERNLNPGLEVRPDLPAPLFVISDLSQLWVLMDIFEKDLALIHPGQAVLVSVPAYPRESFEARIDYIGQVVDETSRTVKVRCRLPNPQGKLLPSMYASLEIQSDAGDRAIIVPLSALFTEGESDWLFVATGNGHYQKRPVKVGLRLKDKAVIREGLHPGERLVVDGALLLRSEQDTEAGEESQR